MEGVTCSSNRLAGDRPIVKEPCGLGRSSFGHAFSDPALKYVDPLRRPCTIARHSAILESPKNLLRVLAHLAGFPEIEDEAHRFAIHPAEKRLDVLIEANGLVGIWNGN